MALVTCDVKSLQTLGKCYNCFSQKENEAAIVYWLEQRRAKLAGQTPSTPFQLRQLTACISCVPTDPVADNLDSATAQQGAVAAGVAGASVITINQIRAAINAYVNISLDDLRSMEVYLRCALNAYP